MVNYHSVKFYIGDFMSEGKFKANMCYLGLAFSYLFIFILRLINFMPYDDGIEFIKARKLSIKIAVVTAICIVLRLINGGPEFVIYTTMSYTISIAGLSVVIYVGAVIGSIVSYLIEKKLYMRAENEFQEYEERMGNRRNTYFGRKLCVAMQNLCDNFLSIGWMCALPIVVIVVVYSQFFDRSSESSVAMMHTYIAGIVMIASLGWKEAAYIYSYRKKREKYYQKEYSYTSSNDNSTYKQYNTYSNQHEETDTEDNEYQDPIMAGYFVGCMSLAELKKTYRKLVKRMHPDVGGDVDAFQRMNNEYEYCLKKWGKKGA